MRTNLEYFLLEFSEWRSFQQYKKDKKYNLKKKINHLI